MASNKTFRSGPTLLTATTTTNLVNPPTTTGGVNAGTPNTYLIINIIRVGCILASGSASFALWLGTTGVNTNAASFAGAPGIASAGALTNGVVVAAGQTLTIPCRLRIDVADFIVGGANAANSLNIEFEGEIGLI